MTKIRYLSLMVLWLIAAALWGQDDFNPANPAEPGAPPTPLVLLAQPAQGGSLNGGGKYVPETMVTVRAYANTGFRFLHWVDTSGHIVSATSEYRMQKGNDADTLIACFEYEPTSPSEPVPGEEIVYYRLDVTCGAGGSVSGGGRYRGGTKVSLSAICNTGFEFAGWFNENNELVSAEQRFSYVTNNYAETLTACFRYNPGNPSEPSDPVLRHDITVDCTEGGVATSNEYVVLEGGTALLSAKANSGYVFLGWYLNDELYTSLPSFSYTMGDSDVHFEARFEFNPKSPSEPGMPDDKQYAFYLMSEITYPGTQIECPLFLTSLAPLQDMTFQLTFPDEVTPDWTTLELDSKAEGYDVSWTATGEPGVYVLTLTGGKVPAGNVRLLNLMLNVPETVLTANSYQVKINQVSVMEEDGGTVTASTRNGRVYVYDLGDTNGDGVVNVTDGVNMVNYLQNGESEDGSFIKEVSDVSKDGSHNVTDVVGIMGIVQKEK